MLICVWNCSGRVDHSLVQSGNIRDLCYDFNTEISVYSKEYLF